MVYEHLFVMDPLASLNRPLDSSLRMLFELAAKGHGIRVCEPKHLAWSGCCSTLPAPGVRRQSPDVFHREF